MGFLLYGMALEPADRGQQDRSKRLIYYIIHYTKFCVSHTNSPICSFSNGSSISFRFANRRISVQIYSKIIEKRRMFQSNNWCLLLFCDDHCRLLQQLIYHCIKLIWVYFLWPWTTKPVRVNLRVNFSKLRCIHHLKAFHWCMVCYDRTIQLYCINWPRYNYLKIWNLRVQKNLNIEKNRL